MSRVEAIISDFGGVLTSPLQESFVDLMQDSGVSLESLGKAMATIAERQGSNPLFELETGRISESAFFSAIEDELSAQPAARWRSMGSARATSSAWSRTSG